MGPLGAPDMSYVWGPVLVAMAHGLVATGKGQLDHQWSPSMEADTCEFSVHRILAHQTVSLKSMFLG